MSLRSVTDFRLESSQIFGLKRLPAWAGFLISGLILALIILLIYHPSLRIGFFAQDYDFLNPVASMDTVSYLRYVLDPRVQILWYRPLQGIQFLLEFWAFGSDPVPYHIVNIGFHIVNVTLLFLLAYRLSTQRLVGLLTALLYATFPVYALAVNWINITDPLMTIFYLLGIWFWLNYLARNTRRDYTIVLLMFSLALLNKQMAITLPVVLFLIDRGWIAQPITLADLIRRYTPIIVVALIFTLVQYTTQSTHTFASVFGYSFGTHLASIFLQYLLLVVFPWGYYPPTDTQITEGFPFADTFNFVWLALAVIIFIFVVWRWRSRALLLLAAIMLIMLIPVLPFPFVELRYLYLPIMPSAFIFALWFDYAWRKLKNVTWMRVAIASLLALLVVGSGLSIANANAGVFEVARQRRVPFRDITRQHPTFAPGTHLYFIDPITPLPELTGMFLMRYGRSVSVGGDRAIPVQRLRDYSNVLVYYFDDTGKPIEVPVDPSATFQTSRPFPVLFGSSLVLDDVEIVRTTLKPGDPLIVLLYWHRCDEVNMDYTVFVHLVDLDGRIVAEYDSQPRKGTLPTSQWLRYVAVVDPIVLPIPTDTLPGEYQLRVGMYDAKTSQRLLIVDPQGNTSSDSFVIQPLRIVP